MLDVIGNEVIASGALDHRAYDLSQRSRLNKFRKAPFRSKPVLRQNQNDSLGSLQLAVETPFPILAWCSARLVVKVEIGLVESNTVQPVFHPLGGLIIERRMGDENTRQARSVRSPA